MSVNVFHGDCLEVMQTLPDKSVDCFVCDLPYGCLSAKPLTIPNTENAHRKACPPTPRDGNPWDIKIDLPAFWAQVKRLAKNDHTPVLMFCTTKFGAELIASNPDWFRYDLVWNKERGVGFLHVNKMPMRSHEMIYVFAKKGAFYKRVDIEGDFPKSLVSKNPTRRTVHAGEMPKEFHDNTGKRCVLSVLHYSNHTNRRDGHHHPTQKPDELYRWLLERYCPEGGTMLDPTAGSFASCRVARDLGLHAVGIEKDDDFYERFGASLVAKENLGIE